MDRSEILDKIEDIQETVDNMNFQGTQEAELWFREGVADYVLELVNNLSQHLVSKRGDLDTSFEALVVKRPAVNNEDNPKMMYCGTDDWGDDVWQPM